MREFVIEDELKDYDTGSGFYQVLFLCCLQWRVVGP